MSDKEYKDMINESFLEKSRSANIEDIYTDSKIVVLDNGGWYAMQVTNGESLQSRIKEEPELLERIRIHN